MKPRNDVTGQFRKRLYELYIHDFGNLACQLITTSEDEVDLHRQAHAINHLFETSGYAEKLKAEVYEVKP